MARIRLARVARLVGFYPDPTVVPDAGCGGAHRAGVRVPEQGKTNCVPTWKAHGTTQRERLRLRIPLGEAIGQTKRSGHR